MALDAKHRSSIYGKLLPLLGEEDANATMSEFPSVEADELVTKQALRAEFAELRAEVADKMHRQTITIVGVIVASVAALETLSALV